MPHHYTAFNTAFIKKLRKQRGITQQETANRLGISRTSYIALEQGGRECTVSELQKLSDMFGTTLDEMRSGRVANLPKYKEMILAYLRRGGSSDGKIPKTKLAKLVYLADFAWFYQTFASMSGMSYRRNHYGPVPDMYFRALDELEHEGKITVERRHDTLLISESPASARQRLASIAKDEMELIEAISKKWKKARTSEIMLFTHGQLPYKLCAPDEIIPYELITQEDPDHVY